MERKNFLKLAALFPLSAYIMKIDALNKWQQNLATTSKMPVLFLGHGSPMNAIEENEFVAGFRTISKEIQKPTAVLCISAHWETKGTYVTAMTNPRTIHDFGGFPKALFDVNYPAPGDPKLAAETKRLITSTTVELDHKWGLDHGAWSVIKHLYPDADVPVIQMSIDYSQPASYHYALAKELAQLRERGVLIVGSGNMVHNLSKVAWDHLNDDNYAFEWAKEANDKMKSYILANDHTSLIDFKKQGTAFQLAIPTPEHFMPLIYTLALKTEKDPVVLFNDKAVGGSLTMTSVKIG